MRFRPSHQIRGTIVGADGVHCPPQERKDEGASVHLRFALSICCHFFCRRPVPDAEPAPPQRRSGTALMKIVNSEVVKWALFLSFNLCCGVGGAITARGSPNGVVYPYFYPTLLLSVSSLFWRTS